MQFILTVSPWRRPLMLYEANVSRYTRTYLSLAAGAATIGLTGNQLITQQRS